MLFRKINPMNSIFKRLILSYIMVLVIPIIIGGYVYNELTDIVEQDAINRNTALLDQAKDMLDARLDEANNVTQKIIFSHSVNSMINNELNHVKFNYYDIWDFNREINKFKPDNEFIRDYYVFLKESDIVVTSSTIYNTIPEFMNKYFRFDNGQIEMDKNMWYKYYSKNYLPATFLSDESSVTMLVQTVPIKVTGEYQGLVMVMLDEQRIKNLLKNIEIGDTGITYIIDTDGTVITSIAGKNCKINPFDIKFTKLGYEFKDLSKDKGFLISNVISVKNRWRLVSVVSKDFLLSKANNIRNVTLGVVFLSLFIGFIAAYSFSYKNFKPIKNIVSLIKEVMTDDDRRDKNEFDIISNTLKLLVNNNINLRTELQNQLPLARMAFFRGLFCEHIQKEQINEYITHIKIDIYGDIYLPVILKIEGYDGVINKAILEELDIIKVLLRNMIEDQDTRMYYAFDINDREIALLCILDQNVYGKLKSNVDNTFDVIEGELFAACNTKVTLHSGEFCRDISDVGNSYQQALLALEFRKFGVYRKNMWFTDIPKSQDNYYYPIEIELKLISSVKSGYVDEVKNILKGIFSENFDTRVLSPEARQHLIYSMKGTILRITAQTLYYEKIADIMAKINTSECIDEIFNHVVRAHLTLCGQINEQKKGKKEKLISNIVEYVSSIYSREETNLYTIASYFEVTEAYMYQLFRDSMGVTFADYLERLRIQKACEMLTQANVSVRLIAKKVGYSSDQTFRRAFKRVMGVVPSEYGSCIK